MKNKTTYPIDYAIKRVRDAIELAEIEGNFQPVRLAVKDLEDAIKAEVDDDMKADQIGDAKLCNRFGCSL